MLRSLVFTCFLIPVISTAQLPAFPTAQGYGANSIGGRGGVVYEVTNLNDNGPGSLRAACEASGARTVVFKIGGIIELETEIQITQPYITLAGQTAPGAGIVLKNNALSIFTHDVIVRGMRFRVGDEVNAASADNRDCVAIQQGAHDVIIDHCSLSWGLDENLEIWDSVKNVSVQWCIISEGLYRNRHPKGPHSMGLLIGKGSEKTSIHHNLLAHNFGRNPLIQAGINHQFVNNVVYDWGYASEFYRDGGTIQTDMVGNYWKPLTNTVGTNEFPIRIDFDASTASGSLLYASQNIYSPNGVFFTATQIQGFGANAAVFSNAMLSNPQIELGIQSATEAFDSVLAHAGAIHPLRDEVDQRIVQETSDSTGGIKDCIYAIPMLLDSGQVISATDSSIIYDQLNQNPAISPEGRKIEITSGTGVGQIRWGIGVVTLDVPNRIVEAFVDQAWDIIPDATSTYTVTATCENAIGSWPNYPNGVALLDTDHDGMPDAWEIAQNLNPTNAADRNTLLPNASGYTALETYLNGLYESAPTGFSTPTLEDKSFSVTQNLADEKAVISYSVATNTNLDLIDILGRETHLKTSFENKKGTYILDTENLNGVYLIRLVSNKGVFIKKIIVGG